MGSDYPELGVFCHAMHNEETSRAWLRHKGHHILLALLKGAEGEEQAVKWLEEQGHFVIAGVALAADNDDEATARLMAPAARETETACGPKSPSASAKVKNEIEAQNNDVHRIDPN